MKNKTTKRSKEKFLVRIKAVLKKPGFPKVATVALPGYFSPDSSPEAPLSQASIGHHVGNGITAKHYSPSNKTPNLNSVQ